MRPLVLLLEPIHAEALGLLEQSAQVHLEEDAAAVMSFAQTHPVQAILTRGRGRVPDALMAACPSLVAIGRAGVGLDNIDVAAASRRGIAVLNAPGSTTLATAEHTMLLMLTLVRRAFGLMDAVRRGHWEARRNYLGDELSDRTLGIIGMGAIGQRVATLASAFGMDVCYWNRSPRDLPYRPLPLPELLATAEVVSLHIALTPETRHLLDGDALASMKRGALLINTARGGLVDAQALLHHLTAGPLGGYAADVLEQEPPEARDPLLALEQVVVTPHTAALTAATFRKMCMRTVTNLLAVVQRQTPEAGCIANAEALSRLPT